MFWKLEKTKVKDQFLISGEFADSLRDQYYCHCQCQDIGKWISHNIRPLEVAPSSCISFQTFHQIQASRQMSCREIKVVKAQTVDCAISQIIMTLAYIIMRGKPHLVVGRNCWVIPVHFIRIIQTNISDVKELLGDRESSQGFHHPPWQHAPLRSLVRFFDLQHCLSFL